MRKMGWAVIHSENIWVARLFRRSATMLTHYAVYLILLLNVYVRFFFYDNLVTDATILPTRSGPAFFYHFWQGKV